MQTLMYTLIAGLIIFALVANHRGWRAEQREARAASMRRHPSNFRPEWNGTERPEWMA